MNIKAIFENSMETFQKNNSPEVLRDSEAYANWLAQTYYFVRHSTALLGFALPHLKDDNLRHHFEKHLGEETRHDVIAIKDLQKMNRDLSEFEEAAATQAFYQSQYYRIQFEGGTALLGYILFLEGLSVHWGKDLHAVVKDIHRGSSFLKVHVEEDPEHLNSAIEMIMSLSPEQQKIIMANFHFSLEMYSSMITNLRRKHPTKKAA
jgi:hypothetical protein